MSVVTDVSRTSVEVIFKFIAQTLTHLGSNPLKYLKITKYNCVHGKEISQYAQSLALYCTSMLDVIVSKEGLEEERLKFVRVTDPRA